MSCSLKLRASFNKHELFYNIFIKQTFFDKIKILQLSNGLHDIPKSIRQLHMHYLNNYSAIVFSLIHAYWLLHPRAQSPILLSVP